MKYIYITIMIITTCIMHQEHGYSASNIQSEVVQQQAMKYFHENVSKNTEITKNLNDLMNEITINNIDMIIYQSHQNVIKNIDIIKNALQSTLKALNSAISDANFDANYNSGFFNRFIMKYVYTNPVELRLMQMKKEIEQRLEQDDLQSTSSKTLNKINSYTYFTAKLAAGTASLMAAVYAGLHYKDVKTNLNEFVNEKTIGDVVRSSSKAIFK